MTQTATPIYLAPADRDFVPHRYVLHVHSQHCRCGALHEHSELYAKTHMRSTMGHKYISNLRPVHRPEEIAYNLPIDIVHIPPKRILICSECVSSTSLSHLPSPPAQDHIVVGSTPDPLRPNKPPAKGGSGATKAPKTPFGIDDL